MKNNAKLLMSGILIGTLFTNIAGATRDYLAKNASFPVIVNGKTWTTDKPIVTIDGSTYLPLRAMGSALGVSVVWNDSLKRVEVGTNTSTTTPKPTETKPTQTVKLYEAGQGFKFNQPTIKKETFFGDLYAEVITEIHNSSGKDCNMIFFDVNAYDKNGKLLGVTQGLVNNLKNGAKKGMSVELIGNEYSSLDYVTIQYSMGM